MRTFLIFLIVGLSSLNLAHALDTHAVSEDQLRRYSTALSQSAGSSQWQQLWANTRRAGHFSADGEQTRFTLAMHDLPDKVRQTLSSPDGIIPIKHSQTWIRRDFTPSQTGLKGGVRYSALCVLVDWKSVPQGTRISDHANISLASLSLTEPCP